MHEKSIRLFGRDEIIDSLWAILEEKSILLTAERRMGKTEVLKALEREPAENYIVIRSNLEGISTPIEFVEDTIRKIGDKQSLFGKGLRRLSSFRAMFDGLEIPKVIKIPESKRAYWKNQIYDILSDVCKHNSDKTILFLWDEIPYMLDNIQKSHEGASLKILDVLRKIRQENDNLRMIYTGSIGIHHILAKVKENSPMQSINDLYIERLPAIKRQDALDMARYRYVNIEKIGSSVDDNLLNEICLFCDDVPNYIEKLIARLPRLDKQLNLETADEQLMQLLHTMSEELNLRHFRDRLNDYYSGEIEDANNRPISKSRLAKSLLNHISISESVNATQCISILTQEYALTFEHREEVIKLLEMLCDDHYLVQTDHGYKYAFSMVRRWWVSAHGLGGDSNE